MATITINERTAKGKSLVNFLKKFEGESFIVFESTNSKTPNAQTLKAIEDARAGKTIKFNDFNDYKAKTR
jgi:antitoxin component of RelBE/YafQ-DinJ toxin-antitoxin module